MSARASPKSSTLAWASAVSMMLRGLQIAVDDALLMRGFERVGDLPGDRHRLVSRQRAVGQPIGERHTIDELENEEPGGGVFLDAVDAGDMRMIQRREQLRLTREARVAFRIPRKRYGQGLDGDVAAEPGVAAPIHLAHAAVAKRAHDFIGADPGTSFERH